MVSCTRVVACDVTVTQSCPPVGLGCSGSGMGPKFLFSVGRVGSPV